MGPKTFEQCAGFLRIADAANPLDNSAVHPESYPIVAAMAADLQCSVSDMIKQSELRKKVVRKKYISESVGEFTIEDILKELEKPGRDPRAQIEEFRFEETIKTMEDLKPGMTIPGIVTNITNFGVFVDIGVKQDGLVHISQLSNTYVSDPNSVVKLQQKVMVTVMEVDAARKRISLSMKATTKAAAGKPTGGKAAAVKPAGVRAAPPREEKETPDAFQAKLMELKKKFK
jgi:uncharacterized protein